MGFQGLLTLRGELLGSVFLLAHCCRHGRRNGVCAPGKRRLLDHNSNRSRSLPTSPSFSTQRTMASVFTRMRIVIPRSALLRPTPITSILTASRYQLVTRSLATASPGNAGLDPRTSQLDSKPRSPDTSKTAYASAASPPEQHQPLDVYHGQPSAIDKAMQMFFFTEIVRGECLTWCCV